MNVAYRDEFHKLQNELGRILVTYYRPGKCPTIFSDGFPVRDGEGKIKRGRPSPRGVIVSFEKDGEVWFGSALCNRKEGDRYDRYFGLVRAIETARPVSDFSMPGGVENGERVRLWVRLVPQSLQKTFEQAVYRSEKVFKRPQISLDLELT